MVIVIVIPTYNERENIEPLVLQLQHQFEKLKHDCHILVVDDNSPDKTSEVVIDLQKRYGNLHLLMGQKAGLGAAYIRGIKYAMKELNAEVVFEMDADFSHKPEDVPRLMDVIDEGYDFVIGSRYVEGGSIPPEWGMYRKLNSKVGNLVARQVAGLGEVQDCTAGFRAIRTSLLKSLDLSKIKTQGYAFQIALLHAALGAKARVVEIPVQFIDRKHGESKLGVKDIAEFIFSAVLLRISSMNTLLKFLTVGASGVLVNLGIFSILLALGMNKFIASPIAIEVSIISNFLFNNYWTFRERKSNDRIRVKGIKFNLVSFLALFVSFSSFVLLSKAFPDFSPQVNQFLGIIPATAVNYFINSNWTFGGTNEKKSFGEGKETSKLSLFPLLIVIMFAIQVILVYFYIPWRFFEFSLFYVAILSLVLLGAAYYLAARVKFPINILLGNVNHSLIGFFLLGLCLRLAWGVLLPVYQESDYLEYWNLATKLVTGEGYYVMYENHKLYAFRPIGFPLLLAGLIKVFGAANWIPLFLNLLIYAGTIFVLFYTIRYVIDSAAAIFGVALFALCPALIVGIGFASTEQLALLLILGLFYYTIRLKDLASYHGFIVGVLLGFSSLARTELQLMLLILIMYLAFTIQGWRNVIPKCINITLGMFVVMLPWIIRNYMVLGVFVPGTTNAGMTLYQANGPLAWGGDLTAEQLPQLLKLADYNYSEVIWSRAGVHLALEWIVNNPIKFIELTFVKQGLLFYNGAVETLWILKKQYQYEGFWFYLVYGAGQLWWVGLWILLGALIIKHWKIWVGKQVYILLITIVLYYSAVFSVLVSQPRHHTPVIGLLIILAATGVRQQLKRNANSPV